MGKRTYHYLKKFPLWLNIFQNNEQTQTRLIHQQTISNKQKKPFISESSDIRKIVWQGAIEIWKHYPVFGSGTETFAYSYYNFQPTEHNYLSEWDFLYNKAHNEFLNILACQGTVGIITYLALIGTTIIYSIKQIKKKKENFIIVPLFTGYITILITNFFGFSVVVTGLIFFLFPAFIFVVSDSCQGPAFTSRPLPVKGNVKARPLHHAILFCLILYAEYFIINLWRADYFFNQGRKYYQANYLVNSITCLQQAIKLNQKEALYHNQLALSAAKLAVVYHQVGLSDQKEASNSAQMLSQLKDLSLQETETSIKLNPLHLNSYKNNARVFIYLGMVDSSFNQQALKTILKAIELAPTDAKLFYNLGALYQRIGQKEKAKEAWKKALDLKPNYDKVERLLK